jgi:hypothetical protein
MFMLLPLWPLDGIGIGGLSLLLLLGCPGMDGELLLLELLEELDELLEELLLLLELFEDFPFELEELELLLGELLEEESLFCDELLDDMLSCP